MKQITKYAIWRFSPLKSVTFYATLFNNMNVYLHSYRQPTHHLCCLSRNTLSSTPSMQSTGHEDLTQISPLPLCKTKQPVLAWKCNIIVLTYCTSITDWQKKSPHCEVGGVCLPSCNTLHHYILQCRLMGMSKKHWQKRPNYFNCPYFTK